MRRIVIALLAAFLTIALIVSVIGPAGAHGDFGEIAAEITPDADDPTEITIRARITYTDDGHPVEDDAIVTYLITPDDPLADAQGGEMPRVSEGQYEVGVKLNGPGSYGVSISSENPGALHEAVYSYEQAPPTTTAPDTDSAMRDDDVALSWPVVVAIAAFLALVGSVVFLAVRRRRG
jgi:hypothetical protein